eukprot:Plantae.Rhodophyta-Purpureofilum_apyrenoidigerum.ctg1381.p1 GENE.Plantae.Rhodophyta-Purpureofilum_apyrenoidigerum.ctg1381~~Plantae.Rhodophyta-Purpureofilum_apyrenoidigerum.ctg1381.p1  ORF type:complete len:368 (-),score=66.31 Plantae.Rhodophyta-Purpureofilum_apyrenoidigerum.ctg1381:2156-3259(-)
MDAEAAVDTAVSQLSKTVDALEVNAEEFLQTDVAKRLNLNLVSTTERRSNENERAEKAVIGNTGSRASFERSGESSKSSSDEHKDDLFVVIVGACMDVVVALLYPREKKSADEDKSMKTRLSDFLRNSVRLHAACQRLSSLPNPLGGYFFVLVIFLALHSFAQSTLEHPMVRLAVVLLLFLFTALYFIWKWDNMSEMFLSESVEVRELRKRREIFDADSNRAERIRHLDEKQAKLEKMDLTLNLLRKEIQGMLSPSETVDAVLSRFVPTATVPSAPEVRNNTSQPRAALVSHLASPGKGTFSSAPMLLPEGDVDDALSAVSDEPPRSIANDDNGVRSHKSNNLLPRLRTVLTRIRPPMSSSARDSSG